MGGTAKKVTDSPLKTAVGVATLGQSNLIDASTGGKLGDAVTSGVNALKGLGGGAKHISSDVTNAGIQQSRDIDASKYANAAPTAAPTAQAFTAAPTTINQGASNQSRGYQDFLSNQLQAQTLGQGPSLAQGQFQQNLDQSIAAQQALATSARGGNIAGAQRQAAMNTGNLNLQGAQQAAQLRQQEQLQAQGLLGQTSSTMRGQDIGLATSQAGLTQQGNIFNAGQQQQNSQFNASQQAQLNDLRSRYMQMGLSAEAANQAADTAFRQSQLAQTGINVGVAQNNSAADAAYNAQIMNTLGKAAAIGGAAFTGGASMAAMPAVDAATAPASVQQSSNYLPAAPNAGYAQPTAGQAAGMGFNNAINPTGQPSYNYNPTPTPITSDARAKQDIKQGGKDMQTFLNEVAPYNYIYKDTRDGVGPQTGVMAQDLEKSKVGKQMVIDRPEGKAIDPNKAISTMLAATAHLNQRLKEIEAGQKAAKVAKVMNKKGGK